MALWLSNEEVEKLVPFETGLEELEKAFLSLGQGRATERSPSRQTTYVSLADPDHYFQFRTIEGGLGEYYGTRIFPQVLNYSLRDGVRRRVTVAAAPGGAGGYYVGFVLLFRAQTAELLAVVQDGYVNWLATGGTGGIGTKYLAFPHASTVGLIGTGWFGQGLLRAVCALVPAREVRVYSPTRAHAEQFAGAIREKIKADVSVAGEVRKVVEGVDIVLCATNTFRPVFEGKWLSPGAHVTSIVGGDRFENRLEPRREVDDETIRRSEVIAATSKEQAIWDRQGDLWDAIVKRKLSQWRRVRDLAELVAGKAKGRTREDQITLFKHNTGLGIWYVSLAARAYEMAKTQGVGREIPDEYFLETLRP